LAAWVSKNNTDNEFVLRFGAASTIFLTFDGSRRVDGGRDSDDPVAPRVGGVERPP